MGNFFTLVSIENTKLWKRLSTKIMLIILVLIIIAATSGVKYHTVVNKTPSTKTISQNWKSEFEKELISQRATLAAMEKNSSKDSDFNIGSMKKNIAEAEYSINNNIKPEAQTNIWGKVMEFDSKAGYVNLIALFIIIACTALVAGEFSEGTMKMMISRPYKRSEILSAKLIAVVLYGLILLGVTLVLNFVMIGILFGFNGLGAKEMLWTSKSIIYIPAVLKTIIIFALNFLEVLVYVIIAFVISAVFRSRSIATGFSLFLLLVGGSIAMMLAMNFSWGKYLPLAMSKFSMIVNNGVYIKGGTLGYSIVLSLIYSIILCFAGYFVFEKRDI